ncbi:FAD-binding oxidoreductase [Rhodobacteraceae bacterium RKSG542]|uniref:NAD(P)/FAD-dependent oxidoreductase n=1 Tax=Pseudovibrio flavus TaxID=2529854 RepID=UPI0012BC9BA2|nr:FAD-binding oxidoreductase [Pseudovibrio flavus]MTI16642.1 FAD-binding oxidoreductase [Pseudovibrio flavus]
MRHILIVGAGIVGLSSAIRMLELGYKVTLVDRKAPGSETSSGNAAGIAWTDVAPLASPGVWRAVPSWLLDPLGPLSVRPAYGLSILPWMLRFSMASLPKQHARSTQFIAALNALALPSWERLWERTGTKGRARYNGCLEVFDKPSQVQNARAGWDKQRNFGIKIEELDGNQLRELEPDLSEDVCGGAFLPQWANVDEPYGLCQDLARFFLESGGTFEQQEVRSIDANDQSASLTLADGSVISSDNLVVAGGAWSRPLAAMMGDRVPLDTERGYNTTIGNAGVSLKHMVMVPGYGFAMNQLSSGLRVGGAVEFGGLKLDPNWKRVDALLSRAQRILPNLQENDGKRWMGYRPSLPDSLPVIGPSRKSDRVVYAFGHGHHGLTQAAATAELVGDLIQGTAPSIDFSAFSAQRF